MFNDLIGELNLRPSGLWYNASTNYARECPFDSEIISNMIDIYRNTSKYTAGLAIVEVLNI
jgi:hypothetical protein